MDKSHNKWIDYWKEDDLWVNSQLWKVNSELFFRRANQILKFGKNDSVLDIGCGPGHLETFLAPLVKSIYVVDISEQSVNLCKKGCRNYNNVSVGLLGHDYTNLNTSRRSFSLILCVSVIQYYRNMEEVEALIASAQKVALPGARMLIVDIPLKRGKIGFAWDALCTFLMSIRYGYMKSLFHIAFRIWLCNSRYKSFLNEVGQLYLTVSDLESLIRRMGLKAEILKKNLSIYANRPSLLIRF